MKAAAAIQESLGRMYGSAVQIRYHPCDRHMGAEDSAVLQFLRDEQLPLPAVFLNGELLYAGSINPFKIVMDVARAWQHRRT